MKGVGVGAVHYSWAVKSVQIHKKGKVKVTTITVCIKEKEA